jgi:hypothetical protein
MQWLSEKELLHVRLESGRHLLQMSNREMLTQAEIVPVIVLMDRAMGIPHARWTTVVSTTRPKATRFAHKAERREGPKPLKPLR